MSYNPQNPNGQATSANSAPVVIASDQSDVKVNQDQVAGNSVSVNNGTSDAGTQRVTLASDSSGQVIARGNVASGAADSGNPVKVGGRFNSTPPTLADGQRGDLQLDTSGNLKVAGSMSIGANSSVNVNQVGGNAIDTNSGNKSTGTQRVVLATDQPQLANALKVDGSAVTQPVSGTVTVQQSTASNLKVDLSGTAANATAIKVDGSAVTQPVSGTITVNMGTTNGLALDATLTGGAQQTKITDGTTVASTLAGDSGQNAQIVAGNRKEVSFTTTTAQAVASTDASNYRWVSVQITTQGTGSTVTFQVSNDNSTWVASNLNQSSSATASSSSNTSSTGIWQGGLAGRYFRLNVTGITLGTTAGVIEFWSAPGNQSSLGVSAAQNGTWTVQPGNTANTTPWLTKTNDGTNSITIKAASTAATATDTAEVVALSPNSPIPAGTNAIGTVNLSPTTTGGWSVSSQTNLTSTATVSGSAGKFGGYMFFNSNSSVAYIQVFDTNGAVTLGTTTPTFVVPIPPSAGANLEITNGVAITNGIKVAATTTATGATTVTTGLTGFVIYK